MTTPTSTPTAISRIRRSSTRLHRVSLETTTGSTVTTSIENDDDMIESVSTTPLKRKQHPSTKNTVASNSSHVEFDLDDENRMNHDSTTRINNDDDDDVEVYHFNGKEYTSYQDMVNAKRQRNQQILEESGLLSSTIRRRSNDTRTTTTTTSKASKRGIQANPQRKKKDPNSTSSTTASSSSTQRRQSSRLQGMESDGLYIDEERAGRVTVVSSGSSSSTVLLIDPSASKSSSKTVYVTSSMNSNGTNGASFYRNRINDGASLSISEAMEQAGPKWLTDTSISDATVFIQEVLASTTTSPNESSALTTSTTNTTTVISPSKYDETSSNKFQYDPSLVQELECHDIERNVAKLCPDRIYSMAVHPSMNHLIVCAGDKQGHVGIWNVVDDEDSRYDNDPPPPNPKGSTTTTTTQPTNTSHRDGIHLFKPHTGAVCAVQWTGGGGNGSGHHLLSASYDGTIRMLDVQQEQFIEVFATYSNDADHKYQHRPGYGIEQDYGHKFWTQHIVMDPRYNESTCCFMSTSVGTAMHIDLRSKNPITFHEQLSEKKVNTLSLHPNGYSLISGGLDNTIALWDVRTLGNSVTSKRQKSPTPLASYNCGRSVNSVYFSPSGKYAVSTTMANKLDIFEDLHLGVAVNGNDGGKKSVKSSSSSNSNVIQPKNSIRHDNMTGRWLTTFQAVFHPQLDLFVVGSMRQPRCIELFDPTRTEHLIRTVQGDGITAVVSRLAFHPRTDQLIVCGGNSSGRVTIVRK